MYHSKSMTKTITKSRLNKKQLHLVCKVDQFASQPFNKGNFGWPRNTISAMANAVNYNEFLMIASTIAKTPAKYNIPEGTSLKDAIAMCRPRMCQSPAELDLFAEQLASRDMDKLNASYLEALKKSASEPLRPVVDKVGTTEDNPSSENS